MNLRVGRFLQIIKCIRLHLVAGAKKEIAA